MKYLCLVYREENHPGALPGGEPDAPPGGHPVALQPVEPATTVRVRRGVVDVTDHPFARGGEQLAAFFLIDARDLNEAIRIVSRTPQARTGTVEVRRIGS